MANFDQIVNSKAVQIGKISVEATTASNSGHPTTALSLTHLVTVLMYHTMRWDPANPKNPGSDRLVLSEGHAVPIIYAACADIGVEFYPHGKAKKMTVQDAMTLRAIDSAIDGHPNPVLGFPFFDAATGSLGQGLSVAAGLAGAARIDKIDKFIYAIMGDGESREGQIWEAMDFIADLKLGHVVAIFNCNTLGQSDFVAAAQSAESLQKKAEAFGWKTVVINGHNPTEIRQALDQRHAAKDSGRPLCIIAKTEKGWGVKSLHGMGHHGTPVEKADLPQVLKDLDATLAGLGAANVTSEEVGKELKIQAPPAVAARPAAKKPAGFQQTLEDSKMAQTVAEKKKLSPRRAFGLALKALGQSNPNVVALDADVKNSTYSIDFYKAFPERFFECRIAEQNMITVAAGLSSGGKIAFASTFGKFLMRAADQIEMALIGGADIKIVGTHVGVTLAADGPSQMALTDVAFARSMAHAKDHRGNPVLTIMTPSDAVSTYALTLQMAEFPSACYLRAVRADLPLLYGPEEQFPFGGFKVVKKPEGKGGGRSVVLAASGYMVHSCLKAAATLAGQGIAATVVDAYCLPMDTAGLLALAGGAGGIILTVEDNYVGGIGSELAEAAAETGAVRVHSLEVQRIPKSGRTPDDVLEYVALSESQIVAAAARLAR